MQTLNCVLGLHICLEFSQLSRWEYANKENCTIVYIVNDCQKNSPINKEKLQVRIFSPECLHSEGTKS